MGCLPCVFGVMPGLFFTCVCVCVCVCVCACMCVAQVVQKLASDIKSPAVREIHSPLRLYVFTFMSLLLTGLAAIGKDGELYKPLLMQAALVLAVAGHPVAHTRGHSAHRMHAVK